MTVPSTARKPPSIVRLSYSRSAIELKQFFRQSDAVVFTFLLPVMFVVIFSTVFGAEKIEGPPGTEPVPFSQYFVAGMIAAGIMSTTFASLATSISLEQQEGVLKRLAGTPLPKSAYFAGKIALALVTSAAQTVIIVALGLAFFGISLPEDPSLYILFGWAFLLGVTASSLLGIAYTRLIRNASAGAAVVQPPFLVLQFISGVFFIYSGIPGWLQVVASVFPLKWMVQAFRQVFLPDWIAVDDYGGSWQTTEVAFVLLGWAVASLVIARLTFRWDPGK
jgi:ABC-2 type transport system permease protein